MQREINPALGSSPLWLLEIPRNRVVDQGLPVLGETDQVQDVRRVRLQSLNDATWRGVNIGPSAVLRRVKQGFVRRMNVHRAHGVTKVARGHVQVISPTIGQALPAVIAPPVHSIPRVNGDQLSDPIGSHAPMGIVPLVL